MENQQRQDKKAGQESVRVSARFERLPSHNSGGKATEKPRCRGCTIVAQMIPNKDDLRRTRAGFAPGCTQLGRVSVAGCRTRAYVSRRVGNGRVCKHSFGFCPCQIHSKDHCRVVILTEVNLMSLTPPSPENIIRGRVSWFPPRKTLIPCLAL